ncbi:hypothetical protein STEG23_000995, partial [Scotinomys teguina]
CDQVRSQGLKRRRSAVVLCGVAVMGTCLSDQMLSLFQQFILCPLAQRTTR